VRCEDYLLFPSSVLFLTRISVFRIGIMVQLISDLGVA